ncbi:MAG: hypothetical protein AABY18_05815 [Candidatus Thermoplasmatota archaeon]
MSQTTLALAIVGSVLTSILYLYIGRVLRLRKVSDDGRLANGMFVLWWHSLGSLGLLGAGMMGIYVTGNLEVWMYEAYTTFGLLVLFLALWGLQFYLMYLYTGSRRSFMPLAGFYAALFLATVALMEYAGAPDRIVDNGWQLQAEPRLEFSQAFSLVFVTLIIGPALASAIAYARLYRKTEDRTQKYRIALVTGAIIVWFGSSVVGAAAQVNQGLAWQFFSRTIGILGALVILLAYKPPQWVRAKYGVSGVEGRVADATRPSEVGTPPRGI